LLHGSASDVGYLTAAIGVGGLVGAFGAMALDGRRLAVPFGLALVFWGVPIALIAPRPDFAAAMVLLAIVGAANSVEDVAVFTLLSLAGKERVAASLVQVSVAAGELVIRAGDAGDRFYIVAHGELEIDADGVRSTAHRPDYFGEIALLRDVPRTASVKASTDS